MLLLRSLLFYCTLVILTICFSIIGMALIAINKKLVISTCRTWAQLVVNLLNIICGLKIDIKGIDNIPSEPIIIASKHQSAIETIILWLLLDNPALIMKKEVLLIPIFGLYCHILGMIPIDRASKIESLKKIIKDATKTLQSKRSIIIFPEGTRTKVGEEIKLRSGIKAIHFSNPEIPVIPITLNSGLFLPKGTLLIKPGIMVIRALEPMPDLEEGAFMKTLQDRINTPCNNN